MDVKKLFAAKPFPKWITGHSIFKTDITKIDKIFPSIGLPNCKEDCEAVDNSKQATRLAKELLWDIECELSMISGGQNHAVDKLANKIQTSIKSFITNDSGKIKLNLPTDIKDGDKIVFKSGEGLFKVYNKLANQNIGLSDLDNLDSFKDFSASNTTNQKCQIVFSSNNIDGIWDIATMSMRGIRSCQSWDGEYNKCVIGSMIDPSVGIIYLTNGKQIETYGSRMISRCVVRRVIDFKKEKSHLFIDKMYPIENKKTIKLFINFLKEQTNNKYNIVYGPNLTYKALNGFYLPLTATIEKIYKHTGFVAKNDDGVNYNSIQSYRDTDIKIGKDDSFNTFIKDCDGYNKCGYYDY